MPLQFNSLTYFLLNFFRYHKDRCDFAHLQRLEDKAVALCRTPNFKLFVFNLPDCQLLRQVVLSESLPTPLEQCDLTIRCHKKEDTVHQNHDIIFIDSF